MRQIKQRRISVSALTMAGVLMTFEVGAAEIQEGALACLTEESYDGIGSLIAAKDERGVQYILDQGLCFVTRERFEASILDRYGLMYSMTKARIYVGGQSAVVHTATENVK